MNYAAARHNMVVNQIRTNRVTNAQVTKAMDEVPRELFVPKQLRGVAYLDEDIDLGGGRYLMEPAAFRPPVAGRRHQADRRRLGRRVCHRLFVGRVWRVWPAPSSRWKAMPSWRPAPALCWPGFPSTMWRSRAARSPTEMRLTAPIKSSSLKGAVTHIPDAAEAPTGRRRRLIAVVAEQARVGKATLVVRLGKVFSSREVFDAAVRPLPGFLRKLGFVF